MILELKSSDLDFLTKSPSVDSLARWGLVLFLSLWNLISQELYSFAQVMPLQQGSQDHHTQ